MDTSLQFIEKDINTILQEQWQLLQQNTQKQEYFQSLFVSESSRIYASIAEAEKANISYPKYPPNEAYMESVEYMWKSVDEYLLSLNYKLAQNWREIFPSSVETNYDKPHCNHIHVRTFTGVLVSCVDESAVQRIQLRATHSHRSFEYIEPLIINLHIS